MAFAQGNVITVPDLIAATAITQYTVVEYNSTTAGRVQGVNTTTDIGFGVCINDPATGEPAQVVVLGIAKVLAGTSTITHGETLGFNSTGVMDHATDNRRSIGIALQASGAIGDLISMNVRGSDRF